MTMLQPIRLRYYKEKPRVIQGGSNPLECCYQWASSFRKDMHLLLVHQMISNRFDQPSIRTSVMMQASLILEHHIRPMVVPFTVFRMELAMLHSSRIRPLQPIADTMTLL